MKYFYFIIIISVSFLSAYISAAKSRAFPRFYRDHRDDDLLFQVDEEIKKEVDVGSGEEEKNEYNYMDLVSTYTRDEDSGSGEEPIERSEEMEVENKEKEKNEMGEKSETIFPWRKIPLPIPPFAQLPTSRENVDDKKSKPSSKNETKPFIFPLTGGKKKTQFSFPSQPPFPISKLPVDKIADAFKAIARQLSVGIPPHRGLLGKPKVIQIGGRGVSPTIHALPPISSSPFSSGSAKKPSSFLLGTFPRTAVLPFSFMPLIPSRNIGSTKPKDLTVNRNPFFRRKSIFDLPKTTGTVKQGSGKDKKEKEKLSKEKAHLFIRHCSDCLILNVLRAITREEFRKSMHLS